MIKFKFYLIKKKLLRKKNPVFLIIKFVPRHPVNLKLTGLIFLIVMSRLMTKYNLV